MAWWEWLFIGWGAGAILATLAFVGVCSLAKRHGWTPSSTSAPPSRRSAHMSRRRQSDHVVAQGADES